MPYAGPPLTLPGLPAPQPAEPPRSPDLLADIPRAVHDLAEDDAHVAGALADLYEARETQRHARRATLAAMWRYDAIPSEPAEETALREKLVREHSDVHAAWNLHEHARIAAERAMLALAAALERYAPKKQPHGLRTAPPAPSLPAPAAPQPTVEQHTAPSLPAPTAPQPTVEQHTAPSLPALAVPQGAQLAAAQRDPAVVRAVEQHTAATQHAETTAAQLAAALERHGRPPEEPNARAAWVRATAERDPTVASTLGAALAAMAAAEQTGAQLAAALAPYTARAPPRA